MKNSAWDAGYASALAAEMDSACGQDLSGWSHRWIRCIVWWWWPSNAVICRNSYLTTKFCGITAHLRQYLAWS